MLPVTFVVTLKVACLPDWVVGTVGGKSTGNIYRLGICTKLKKEGAISNGLGLLAANNEQGNSCQC